MALSKITNASVADTAVHGRRNLLINGAMQVAQRGTSFSSISGSTYTLDRWAIRNATSVSKSTDVPSGEGFKNSLYYDNDGTRSSINIRQPMEDVTRLLNDRAITLSFWLKSSAATTVSVDLCDVNSTNVTVTTSWAKYTVTFPATSNLNSGNTYESGAGWLDFNLGTDYPDVYLTGVQLEVGDKATPFEHRSFAEELNLCQRYYEKGEYLTRGAYIGNGRWQQTIPYKVTKRTSSCSLSYSISTQTGQFTSGNSNPDLRNYTENSLYVYSNSFLSPTSTDSAIGATWQSDAEL